jgi:hypothetical protein
MHLPVARRPPFGQDIGLVPSVPADRGGDRFDILVVVDAEYIEVRRALPDFDDVAAVDGAVAEHGHAGMIRVHLVQLPGQLVACVPDLPVGVPDREFVADRPYQYGR